MLCEVDALSWPSLAAAGVHLPFAAAVLHLALGALRTAARNRAALRHHP